MFQSEGPDNYEIVYKQVLEKLAKRDLNAAAGELGLEMRGEAAVVPCLGRDYLVDHQGARAADGGRAALDHCIVLAYYLMHGGRGEATGRFAPYRELPGGADFARSLSVIVEGRLVKSFSGRLADLKAAAAALGGRQPPEDISADGAWVFDALPTIPMLLTFYDEDEEFPAEARTLYDLCAPNHLDMECLAVLGLMLVMDLEKAAGLGG